ncbi:hypothetical protein C1646_752743 [Rhizophagus diaphanus]|nr:hypothetical protein C1646_752743 [Rhizophagus diaphanus] [Rhizophagus sp. MUCL 43196]
MGESVAYVIKWGIMLLDVLIENDGFDIDQLSEEKSDNMMERSIDYTLLIANTTNVTSLCSIQFNKVIMDVLYNLQSIS